MFGLGFGLSKKKGKDSYEKSGNYNSQYSSTPTAPDYWVSGYQNMLGQSGLMPAQSPAPQGGEIQTVSSGGHMAAPAQGGDPKMDGLTPLQAEGAGQVSGQMTGDEVGAGLQHIRESYLPHYANSDSYTMAQMEKKWGDMYAPPTPVEAQQIQARQGSEFMDAYKNPYLDQILDSSLADYDAGVDRSANSFRAGSISGGQGGNSRQSVAAGVLAGDAARGRGALSSGIRDRAFSTALGAGMQDANRYYSADATNASNDLAAQTYNSNLDFQRKAHDADSAYRGDAMRMDAVKTMQDNLLTEGMFGNDTASLLYGMGQGQFGNLQQQFMNDQLVNFQNPFNLLTLGTSLFGEDGSEIGTYDEKGSGKYSGSGFSASGGYSKGA